MTGRDLVQLTASFDVVDLELIKLFKDPYAVKSLVVLYLVKRGLSYRELSKVFDNLSYESIRRYYKMSDKYRYEIRILLKRIRDLINPQPPIPEKDLTNVSASNKVNFGAKVDVAGQGAVIVQTTDPILIGTPSPETVANNTPAEPEPSTDIQAEPQTEQQEEQQEPQPIKKKWVPI